MKSADAVNRFDEWGNTPLINACQEVDLAKMKSLLKQGGNPNIARKSDGNAPLHLMTGLDGEQALPAGESLLFMNALIQSGANVNLANKEGKTPLMLTGLPAEIDVLVKAGAKLDLQDHNGQTALMAAAQQNRTAAVMKLLQHGASPNVQDKQGKTALMIAKEAGNAEVIDLLSKANTIKEEPHVNKYLRQFPRVEEADHSNKPENQASR